jgi:hypothetical protein
VLPNNFCRIFGNTLPKAPAKSPAAAFTLIAMQIGSHSMRKVMLIILAASTLALAGCQTARQTRQASGALIGGGTGALIGGLASHSVGGALVGGAIGALAGAVIADATRPQTCVYRTRSGRIRYYRC